MSTFMDDVRNGRVSPPTSKGFNPSLWTRVKYEETRDDRDRRFAEVGLFFFKQLEQVRSRLPEVFTPFVQSPSESMRLIVGFQNRHFRRIQSSTDFVVENASGPSFLESLMSAEIDDELRSAVSVDDSLRVDATSLIVRELQRARGNQV